MIKNVRKNEFGDIEMTVEQDCTLWCSTPKKNENGDVEYTVSVTRSPKELWDHVMRCLRRGIK